MKISEAMGSHLVKHPTGKGVFLMNVNELDTKKTGLLFFDLLNVYYRGGTGGDPETHEAGGG